MTAASRSPRRRLLRYGFPAVVLGALAVSLLLEHGRPSPADLPRFAPPPPVELAPVELGAGEHVLEGRVLHDGGGPAAEVLVELVDGGEPHWDHTDADGAFRLDGLTEGRFEVALVLPGHAPVVRRASVPGERVSWTLPAPLPPIEALPEIERQALYGDVSSPLGAEVGLCELLLEPREADPLSGVLPRRVPIGRDGGFAVVDLALGRYRVSVLPPWAKGGSWPRLAGVDLVHGNEVRDLHLVLEAGEIRGRLVRPDGEPVARALVTLHPADRPERVWPPVRSDAEGRYAVGDLPPGRYRVTARAGAGEVTGELAVGARETAELRLPPLDPAAPGPSRAAAPDEGGS